MFREVRVYEIKEVLRLWLRGDGLRSIEDGAHPGGLGGLLRREPPAVAVAMATTAMP